MSGGWADWLREGRFAGMSEEEREEQLRLLGVVRDQVLDLARLGPGDDVLDLGAGTGLLTFGAHERIGDGWVIAVDPEVDNLQELLRTAHGLEAAGISYLVGDAEVLPLPDASVDAAVTRSVLMYVEDLAEAARELFRVLRPGGRLACYEPLNRRGTYLPTTVDWTPVGADLAARVAAEWEAHAASSALMRLDEGALEGALQDAGFAEVSVEVGERDEPWLVDEASAAARLDAVGAAGEPSLRERWARTFAPHELELFVAHLGSLAGTTLTFRRAEAWVSATRP
ncbi:MAG: methyltransferase domain-containing protein [Actinobacteria bacterium]|nr:methyltransferase domain-containing protein [Actinomycetota bacterium]